MVVASCDGSSYAASSRSLWTCLAFSACEVSKCRVVWSFQLRMCILVCALL